MAQIGKVIHKTLIDDTNVTGIVGSGANARIYPNHVEQGDKYPAIVYQTTRVEPHLVKTDTSKTDTYDIDVHFDGSKYEQIIDLADKARVALDDLNGIIQGIDIDHGVWMDRQEQPAQGAGDKFIYHIIDEYSIRVRN